MWLPGASLLLCALVNSALSQSTGNNQPNAYQANINAQVDIKPLYDFVNSMQGGSQSFANPQYSNPYTINGANAYGQQQNAGANQYGAPQTAYPTYGTSSSSAQYGANPYGGAQYASTQYGGNAYSGAQNGASGYDPSNPGLYANLNGQQLNVGFNDPYQQQTAYDQQASSTTGAGGNGFVVRNPNSQFAPQLRSMLNDVQSGKTIDFNGRITASGTGSGSLGGAADSSQSRSAAGNQGQQFTNNIYGYDYRSNPDMKYTINGNEAQYQPPQYNRYEPPQGSPFGRRRRQARYEPYSGRSSFAGTAYQNQDILFQRDNSVMQQPLFYSPPLMDKSFPNAPRSNWQFYDPGMNMTAMYYPYRTTVEEHPIG